MQRYSEGSLSLLDASGDNTATTVEDNSGRLYGLAAGNENGHDIYIQLFDAKSADITVGTTTPKLSFLVPALGEMDKRFTIPIRFSTAISYTCTKEATGSTHPSQTLTVNILYA